MNSKFKIIETEDYVLAVSDAEIKTNDYKFDLFHKQISKINNINSISKYDKKIVAHQLKNNAKELDGLPLLPEIIVEDDVEKLPYAQLCYYDTRNPDFQIKEEYGYNKEEVDATGEFPKKDCACDNCFYGRAELADRIIKMAHK